MKRRRYFTLTLLFLVIAGLITGMKAPVFADDVNKPQSEAVSAMLFDARRGQVIISKNPDEITHSPVATRIMTALVAVEKVDIEAMVTASKDVVNTEGATLKLTVGEKYAVKNLLFAQMLTGSPDAARAIAEYVGGSEEGFVSMMNEYASRLSLQNTHFTSSTGAYDENQTTTANDISILIRYALTNTNFNRFFSTSAKPWYDEEKGTMLLTNTNNMFFSYDDGEGGTDGGITASFDKDFQSIITTVTKNSMRLVCLLIDVPTKSMYTDSIAFLDYGFDNYLHGTLVSQGSSQRAITVEGQTLNLIPTADVQYIYPRGQYFIKNVDINIDESKLKPPITKKTIIGKLIFTLMDDTVINIDLYPDREILPQKTKSQILKERLQENKELVYVIIGLIILEVIIGLFKFVAFVKKRILKLRARRLRH